MLVFVVLSALIALVKIRGVNARYLKLLFIRFTVTVRLVVLFV